MSGEHQPGKRTGAASTERARRCRARRNAGVRWVPGFDVTREALERLVAEGWTSEAEARNPERLSDAVSDLIDCWGRRMVIPDVTALHKSS